MTAVRASLEVGFPAAEGLPPRYAKLRGRDWRAIEACEEFPFEDAQFDVVLMAGPAVSRQTVREAHRVLKPEGTLCFTVPERTKKRPGYTLPDVYKIVRDGFNITGVERPAWRFLFRSERTLSIVARKKNWRAVVHSYRPYV